MPILPRQTVQQLTDWPKPQTDRLSKVRLDAGEHTTGFGEFLPFDLDPILVASYPSYAEFVAELANQFAVGSENILLTNGSDEGLELIAETFIEPGVTKAVCNTPSFVVIPRTMQRCGADLVQVPVNSNDLSCNVDAVEKHIAKSGAQLAMFASPDNPTGMLIEPDVMRRWCARFPDTLFVIDEAYFEFTGITSMPLVLEARNLIVTRTFSKAWGLAGLRLGVLVGHADVIRYPARVALIYNVNCLAIACAMNLLAHREKVGQAALQTLATKRRVVEGLRHDGFSVHEGFANFFLINLEDRAVDFARHCESEGILVRVCAPQAKAGDVLFGRVRVSVGTAAESDRFLGAARSFVALPA